jgi:hypothetical protein
MRIIFTTLALIFAASWLHGQDCGINNFASSDKKWDTGAQSQNHQFISSSG